MDPASATSLAAAILQLATFTGKVLSRSTELYQRADGSLRWHAELSSTTQSFEEMLAKLSEARTTHGNEDGSVCDEGSADNSMTSEGNLERLACEAKVVTQELLALLQTLSSDARPKQRLRSLRQAILTVWNERKLQELEERVVRYRSQIDSILLHHLSSYVARVQDLQRGRSQKVSTYADIVTAKSSRGNKDARKSLQTLAKDEPKSLEVPRNFATNLLAEVARPSIDKDRRAWRSQINEQLLDALDFRELRARHEAIPEAYAQTFDWIYQVPEGGESASAWSDYTKWLQNDSDLYWIAGKPGAGKSTLMKYLFDDERTRSFAKSWAHGRPLRTAGFFFWNSGTEIQMSRSGLVRTLLRQLCAQGLSMQTIFPRRWHRCDLFGWSPDPYTWEELKDALHTTLSDPRLKFLLFIDGLDEFDGNKDELIDLVLELSAKPNVKICVASRPWVEFQSRFRDAPQLCVENLTRRDITTYIEGRFSSSDEFREMQKYEAEGAQQLTTSIVDRASGVFLWVYVVVDTLLYSVRDGAHMEDLLATLHSLPLQLNLMFERILEDIDPKFEQEAFELIQFVNAEPEHATLISLYWSHLTFEEAINAKAAIFSEEEARYHSEKMKRILYSRCKCLLDIPSHKAVSPTLPVAWLHRTAREYCQQDEVWAKIRARSHDYDIEKALAFSRLRQAKAGTTSTGREWTDINNSLSEVIARPWTQLSVQEKIIMFDDIEAAGTIVRSQFLQPSQGSLDLARYWLKYDQLPCAGYTIADSTLFHIAIGLDLDWYVKHRIFQDPKIIHMPVSSGARDTACEFAIRMGRWTILEICLREGSPAERVVASERAWKLFLIQTAEAMNKAHLGRDIPFAAEIVRCASGFLENGADAVLMDAGFAAKISWKTLLESTRDKVPSHDYELIKDRMKKARNRNTAIARASSTKEQSSRSRVNGDVDDVVGDADLQPQMSAAFASIYGQCSDPSSKHTRTVVTDAPRRRKRDMFMLWR